MKKHQGFWIAVGLALFAVGLFLVLVPRTATDVRAAVPAPPPLTCLQPSGLVTVTQAVTETVYLPVVRNLNCRVGVPIEDPLGDVSMPHIDILKVSTQIGAGNVLTATFALADVPPQLPFNRPGVPRPANPANCTIEYTWEVWLDLDNNRATGGPASHEYLMIAWNCVRQGMTPANLPIPVGAEHLVFEWRGPCPNYPYCFQFIERGKNLLADPVADTLAIWGRIPGISTQAVHSPSTFDYNPGGSGQTDLTDCYPQ